MKNIKLFLLICIILSFFSVAVFAMNPFVTHLYTADPTARVFENRVYVYASHDKDNAGEYDMDDYHVFSSADLVHWVDHGVVFSYKDLDPVDENGDGLPDRYGWVEAPTDTDPTDGKGIGKDWYDRRPCFWAPDCVAKWDPSAGKIKYYLYYPAQDYDVPTDKVNGKWRWNAFKIGVAVSDSPCGPFVPYEYPAGTQDPYGNTVNPDTGRSYEGQIYIPGSYSIDPTILIDDDGKVYMIWGGVSYGGINDQKVADGEVPAYIGDIGTGPRIAQLDPVTMATLITKPKVIHIYDENYQPNDSDYYEGPWIHKRNGIYYLSYPNPIGTEGSEMHYAMTEKDDSIPLDSTLGVIWRTPTDITKPYDPNTNTNKILPSVGEGMTSHGSIVEYQGSWYVFYHTAEMAEREPSQFINRKRSICVEKLEYNTNGTIKETQITRTGPKLEINPYSQVKAMFYSSMDGIDLTDCGGDDIGQAVGFINDGDYLGFDDLDFGTIGANSFEARVSSNTDGGTIEVWLISGHATQVVGTIDVPNTGGWDQWITLDCVLDFPLYSTNNIWLEFKGGSGSLFNLNWFKFKPAASIPVGYSMALKSQNPNCIDNKGQGPGQKYLCVDSNFPTNGFPSLCANRNAVAGAWEKFSLLAKVEGTGSLGTVQLNSSNNGRKLRAFASTNSVIIPDGGYYYSHATNAEMFFWEPQFDGTIALKSLYNNNYLCVDSSLGNNPAFVYTNRSEVGQDSNGLSWEKYYAEVADAPVGCIVAFKSQNPNCIDNNNNIGQKYLCVDTSNNYQLCVNRAAVGGSWEKFLVEDAGNGYIALKSLNNNKYLRFPVDRFGNPYPGMADMNSINYTTSIKLQWQNNGDGTISLIVVDLQKYLCVDSNYGNTPAKVYPSRAAVGGSWEKFYCQIIQ